MPAAARKADPLSKYADGVVAKSGARSWPIPLASTRISVSIRGGVGFVETTRVFRNAEDKAIEATMTFPVPGDAILTGLRAKVDDRELLAVAQPRKQARESYEAAIDEGKAAILHEELLRGVHMLSLGNLAPGKEASVVVSFAVPLSFSGPRPILRIPTTVGDVYGRSPLPASDDIETADGLALEADVEVTCDCGTVQVDGLSGASGRLPLNGAVVAVVDGWASRPIEGVSASGGKVSIRVTPLEDGERALDASVLFDVSGSTMEPIPGLDGRPIKRDAMRAGLDKAGRTVRPNETVRLYEFDNRCDFVDSARGEAVAALAARISDRTGGTEIGGAVLRAQKDNPGKDVILMTDGRSYALDVQDLASKETRVHVVLIGKDALDAQVGHLAALTGGHCLVVDGARVDEALVKAFSACRVAASPARFDGSAAEPRSLRIGRGGAEILVEWTGSGTAGADEAGRFAAGLAIVGMAEEDATEMALAHGLCTHLTSLVIVDEAAERQQGIPAARKIPLMRSAAADAMGALSFVPSGGRSSMRAFASMAPMLSTSGFGEGGGLSWRSDVPDMPLGRLSKRGARPFDVPDVFPSPTGFGVDAKATGASIDWESDPDRLAGGDLSTLPAHVRLSLMRIAEMGEVKALAAELGKPAIAVAIALVALGVSGSRSAARLARRVLGTSSSAARRQAEAAVAA